MSAVASHPWEAFLNENISVLGVFSVVCTMVVAVYLLDRRWRRLQTHLEKVTGVMNESRAFSFNLVRHFMPSFKVEKYQFRGMKAKKSTAGVEFDNLGLDLPSGKRVLNGVTGRFEAGSMCAIMGPSGVGKTTFMNTLCGKATYGQMFGSMKINGQETNPKDLKGFMGFVPQDDIVHQDLTVREQIQFSVRLRGDRRFSGSRVELITEDVLNVMQIDHIQNSIVGSVENRGISGGQRKRVNVGLELAAEPSLLFLDEPTSGLDATSSLAVCLSLKKMCQLGMTSIMVIHQPRYSLFTLFDDVLLLGKGGETVYLGSSLGAKEYFEGLGFEMPRNENPADWFMDVLSGEVQNPKIPNFKPEQLFDIWRTHAADGGGAENADLENADLEGQQQQACVRLCASRSRMLSPEDDKMVLAQKLEEEWNSVDFNNDGVMDADELRQLLSHCASMRPDEKVVCEIMARMAGDGAKEVTKRQFLDYLCSLSGDVANDEMLRQLDKTGVTGPHLRGICLKVIEGDNDSAESSEETSSAAYSASLARSSTLQELAVQKPGFLRQLMILSLRRLVQWWRMNRQRAIFFAALGMGGVVLAVLDGFIVKSQRWDAMTYLNLHTCLALLLSIFCLNVFGNDQPVFWRESASGINVSAYHLSKVLVNTVDIAVQTFLFTSIYYLIRQPFIPYWEFIIPFLFTAYAASGWGYLVSTVVPPQHGPFIVSLVSFIICGLLGNPATLANFFEIPVMKLCVSLVSITRWSVQMSFVIGNDYLQPEPTDVRDQVMLDVYKQIYMKEGTTEGQDIGHSCIALFGMGLALRFFSYLGLRFMNRSKQV
mmetsp:Transcript_93850/g.303727  ORF Transcript_93850/g.303727 Transcript_93850/m.303727 type:complete len:824 (+) Transcript_93850:61-2532(+)